MYHDSFVTVLEVDELVRINIDCKLRRQTQKMYLMYVLLESAQDLVIVLDYIFHERKENGNTYIDKAAVVSGCCHGEFFGEWIG